MNHVVLSSIMSSRERLIKVFKRQPADRLPYTLGCWGVDPMFPRPDWKPLYELIEKYQLDIIRSWTPTEEERPKGPVYHSTKVQSQKENMLEKITTMETPAGQLTQIYYIPKDGSPGYVKKHYIEAIEDAKKWLSIPPPILPKKVDSYFKLERKTKKRAMLMIWLPEPMYSVQSMIGSMTFSYWLIEERELLHEMIDKSFKNIVELAKTYLSFGIGDAYGWVGPELCIPPLASPKDFNEFVFEYDKKIIDLIHNAGKLVFVHCHGDMGPVLEKFVEMGVDCLHPVEPPPIGSITLKEAKEIIKGRMTIYGNVPNGYFDTLEPNEMEKIVEDTIAQGKPNGCFILTETSSPSTWPKLNEKHIANYKVFVETWAKLASY